MSPDPSYHDGLHVARSQDVEVSRTCRKGPSVIAVILNWNGIGDTLVCLDSLQNSSYEVDEVLVIDNGSIVNEALLVDKYTNGEVDTIRLSRNTGFAAGCNLGMRVAMERNAEFVLLLNNDIELSHYAIEKLMDAARNNPDGAVYGPIIFDFYDRTKILTAGGTISVWRSAVIPRSPPFKSSPDSSLTIRTGWVEGAALLVRVQSLRNVGLMDPAYFAYREETDLEYRFLMNGWRIYCVQQSVIYHKGSASSNSTSKIRIDALTRNRLLFIRKYGRTRQIFAFAIYYSCLDLPYNIARLLTANRGELRSWRSFFSFSLKIFSGLYCGTIGVGRFKEPDGNS